MRLVHFYIAYNLVRSLESFLSFYSLADMNNFMKLENELNKPIRNFNYFLMISSSL